MRATERQRGSGQQLRRLQVAWPGNAMNGMGTVGSSNTVADTPLLHAVVHHDFQGLVDTLEPDATMRALLPGGLREWTGAAKIAAVFERWLGDTVSYEVDDAATTRIGDLLSLRWRLRLRAERFGEAVMVVEQQAYAATGSTGRIAHISLLCSGFRAQHHDADERI